MASNIKVPDFDFSGFYYPEILEALLEYKRENIPEITTENPFDPGIQLMRAFALVGHLNNTLLDLAAQESYLESSRLRESVVQLLALIGYRAAANIPARSVLRMELTQGFNSPTIVVPDNALFGTRRRADTPEVLFEADGALTVGSTEEIGGFWQYNSGSLLWSNKTIAANADASQVVVTSAAGIHIYFGHGSTLTDSISFEGITQGLDLGDNRVASPRGFHLQYFDGNLEDARPDVVTFPGSSPTAIRFEINGLVGVESKVGTFIHATLNQTGATDRLAVQFDGVNFIETDGFLGQSIVSVDRADYTIGSYWHDLDITTDTTLASPPQIAAEAFDTGDTVLTSFGPQTLSRWPLDGDTVVQWDYFVGAIPAQATFDMGDGSLGGAAVVGTTVDPATGIATLVVAAAPDAGAITVSYYREGQRLQQDGEITFAVPMTSSDDWISSVIPDDLRATTGPTVDAFWLRIIVPTLGDGAGSDLQFDRFRWDRGQMYLRVDVTQGETTAGEILGSGDGLPSQSFELAESPVLEGSVLFFVDDVQWTQVSDFFASDSTDQHYTVDVNSDGVATVLTGDGVNGSVVADGVSNVTAEYRVGGAEDGNVGTDQIIVNRTGVSRVRAVSNPRAASGWVAQQGSGDEFDLERLKRVGVSSLRTLERAVSPSDVQFLTVNFQAEDDSFPYSRAKAIENGFGDKTIKNVVVPKGGSVPSSLAKRDELDLYFNGNLSTGGVTPGVGPSNQEILSIDYTPVTIDVTATITGGDEATLKAFLSASIQPEALLPDGLTYRWAFGQDISDSMISSLFFQADNGVIDVDLTLPSGDTILGDEELPQIGTIILTMVPT